MWHERIWVYYPAEKVETETGWFQEIGTETGTYSNRFLLGSKDVISSWGPIPIQN